MFERYNEPARRVIFFARYEASHFGSRTIETEHLLLGVLRKGTRTPSNSKCPPIPSPARRPRLNRPPEREGTGLENLDSTFPACRRNRHPIRKAPRCIASRRW